MQTYLGRLVSHAFIPIKNQEDESKVGASYTGKYAYRSQDELAPLQRKTKRDTQGGVGPLDTDRCPSDDFQCDDHTLNAGLSASLRACATRSCISVLDMLFVAIEVSATHPRPSLELPHLLESVREGVCRKRRHEPASIGTIRCADGMVSGI